jgi:hypothetical protein
VFYRVKCRLLDFWLHCNWIVANKFVVNLKHINIISSTVPDMDVSEEIIARRATEVEAIYNLAKTLNTGLDRRVLAILLELVELGVHPESLVDG